MRTMTKQMLPIQVTCEWITPAKARDMLAGNYGNRPLRKAVVDRLAAEMRSGYWQLSHQGIAFSSDGRLLDGQHRLNAVIKADVAVQMMVARNVPDDAFKVTDRGVQRTIADVTRQDKRIVEACSFIARLHGYPAPSAAVVERVIAGCGEAVMDLVVACGKTARGRSAAPIKAAAALRIMQGHKDYVLRQWRALILLEYADMTPAMQILCRQLTDDTRTSPRGNISGTTLQYDRAARAWVAFDPARAYVTRIAVRDIAGCMSEMRAVWALE
jgi:hypothetical protein